LKHTIDATNDSLLRTLVKQYCDSIPELNARLEEKMLVKDVVRHHPGKHINLFKQIAESS
jgi:hypothetical protein